LLELVLDDLDGRRRIVRLDDLEQPIGRAVVRGVEAERRAQVLDRRRRLAEHDHRLAGLGPGVGAADRVARLVRPTTPQRGQQPAAPGVAELMAQLGEAACLRVMTEYADPCLERIDQLLTWMRVVGHSPGWRGVTILHSGSCTEIRAHRQSGCSECALTETG